MSREIISSETQRSKAEFTEPSLSVNLLKPSKSLNKKKVTWKMKEQMHLHLQLQPNQQEGKFYSNHPSTLLVKTPAFSPLRLKKNAKDIELNKISLSAKYAYKVLPTINISTGYSPVILTAKSSTFDLSSIYNNNSNKNYNKNNKISCYKNDYSNNYIHSGVLPFKYIRNSKQQVEGYPKLQKLFKLKEEQIAKYATRPYGARIETKNLVSTMNSWVYDHDLQFDVIMIGALTENQLIYPLLTKLPIDKLCSKPGFLFIWASTQKISELSTLMNDSNTWTKRFRRSEELVFIPVDKNSVYYPKDSTIPENQLLEELQWHCWMCITGTVRRSTDKDLIHCNVNTDLSLENSNTGNAAVPSQIYKVVENFSSSTRRLHIIPTSTGLKKHVNVRPGWVIASPDIILDNFESDRYKKDIEMIGSKIPFNEEIEQLRPKTPA
jgi:N6-adenosine-specific RNA methylase IME4